MSVTTKKEKITPQKARAYLSKMAANRPLMEGSARTLADAIKAGEWKVNGETIKFNDCGQLEDGQHRLQAVIIADTPIESFVTRGLPSNIGIFETIDIGRKRTSAHILARRGEANYALLAGALAWLWRYRQGFWQTKHQAAPRPQELTGILADNPAIRESLHISPLIRSLMSPSLAVCLHYLFSKKDKKLAEEFFAMLGSGENLSRTSPDTSGIYQVRSRLISNRSGKAKLPCLEIAALVVKAWNATRTQTVLRALRWRTDGSTPEQFPDIE